jgi:ATP-dependent Clp protease ATP-binding subunit ClpA
MFERFTDRTRQVVVLAQSEARRLEHSQISTEHLLLGMLRERRNVAIKVLVSLGVPLEAVRVGVEERIGQGQTAPSGKLPFTPAAEQVLERSLEEADQLRQHYVGTEHLLLGLVGERTSIAAQVLAGLGADPVQVRVQLLALLAGGRQQPAARAQPDGQPGRADLREFAAQPVQVRQATATVVDAQAFDPEDVDTVAARDDRWVRLLFGPAERDPAGMDVQAVLAANQRRLQGEVERLRDLLGQHRIDPGRGTAPPP